MAMAVETFEDTPLSRIESLREEIAKGGDEAQELRRLSSELVEVLIDEGLFRFTLPRALGGEDASVLETIEVLEAISAIDAYTYGFVMQEEALPFDTEEELKMLADMMLQQFPEKEYPYFAELVTKHALKPGYSYKDEFEFGLDLILDGLERAIGSPSDRGS